MKFEFRYNQKQEDFYVLATGHEDEIDHICSIVDGSEWGKTIFLERKSDQEWVHVKVDKVLARFNARRRDRKTNTRRENPRSRVANACLRIMDRSRDSREPWKSDPREYKRLFDDELTLLERKQLAAQQIEQKIKEQLIKESGNTYIDPDDTRTIQEVLDGTPRKK